MVKGESKHKAKIKPRANFDSISFTRPEWKMIPTRSEPLIPHIASSSFQHGIVCYTSKQGPVPTVYYNCASIDP